MNDTIEPQRIGRLARRRQRINAWAHRWAAYMAPSDHEQERDPMSRPKKALLAIGAMTAILLWALVLTRVT